MALNGATSSLHQACFIASFIACVICCLPTTTTALPMKDVIGQMLATVKMEQQQQQQQLQHQQQQLQDQQEEGQEREKREVTECTPPTDLQAMFEQINANKDTSVFLQAASIGYMPSQEKLVNVSNESDVCPDSLTSDASLPLRLRSTCPFYFKVLELPTGYFPPSLPYARCKCDRCLDNSNHGCSPIVSTITVLKPDGCFQGMRKYVQASYDVNTGCTCTSA